MLRELIIFNTDVSRNQGEILPEMSKISGGAPVTRWKLNFMSFT